LEILDRIPTTTPQETLGRVCDVLEPYAGRLTGLGIASFGPLDLDPKSAGYGSITQTPKPYWSHTPVRAILEMSLGVPTAIQTDVNGAALGEFLWGAGQGADPFVYLTVGTGIGGGVVIRGEPLVGLLHPEMGHMRVIRAEGDLAFPGICPFHGDCLEGLASGPAMGRRWNQPAQDLPVDHPGWEVEAWYLAQAIVSITYIVSPRRIVLGGGVGGRADLRVRVRKFVETLLGGYQDGRVLADGLDSYLVAPGLGDRSAVCGAMVLGHQARERARTQEKLF
jgi:fructokinase